MDDIIQGIQTVLNAALGSTYTGYIYGEVKVPNESMYPFIEIKPLSTEFILKGTGGLRDNLFTIDITVKNSIKKSFTDNTSKTVIAHIQDLIKKMEERDSTGTPKSTTVLGAINNDLTLNNTSMVVGQFNISYDNIEYDGSYIVMATLRIVARLLTPNG